MASLCMQDVVNDPNASDGIAKSVSTSKNRYLNMQTCEMSRAWYILYACCITYLYVMQHVTHVPTTANTR